MAARKTADRLRGFDWTSAESGRIGRLLSGGMLAAFISWRRGTTSISATGGPAAG
jgi:hypothetical protein